MKNELRKKYLDLRKEKNEEELLKDSEKIVENLENLEEFKKAKKVMVYVSYRKEVNTHELIKKILAEKGYLSVPLCGENCSMTARKIKSFSDLVSGSYGILEPKSDAPIMPKEEIDFVVVPGCAFSRTGHRIGYGKGYYDRFLKGISAKTAGFSYNFSLAENLPYEKTDVPLDYVITEKEVIKIKK